MGEKMKKINNQILSGDYEQAFMELENINYSYSIDDLQKDFPKIKNITLYSFLMYLLYKEERPIFHFSLCQLLMYDPFFYNKNIAIYKHVMHCFEIAPYYTKLYQWVIDEYDGNPDSPFSLNEMELFKITIIQNQQIHIEE